MHELAATKMVGLVELKYNTISDAAREFGSTKVIRETFMGTAKLTDFSSKHRVLELIACNKKA